MNFSLRMRRKNWKNPGRVYVDSQVFEENIQVYASFEVFLEILEGLSISLSSYQITVITCSVLHYFCQFMLVLAQGCLCLQYKLDNYKAADSESYNSPRVE